MPAPETLDELRQLQAIPHDFNWVVADKIAGMCQPTSVLQLLRLKEQLAVRVVINLTDRDIHRSGLHLLGEGAPQLLHIPLPGMVIACYLVAEEGFAAHEAIQLVREKRPHSLVCSKQELAVHRFAAYLDELR